MSQPIARGGEATLVTAPAKKKKIVIVSPGGANYPLGPKPKSYNASFVTFSGRTNSGLIVIQSLLDSTVPQIIGGYGGWQTVARKKKVAIVDWQGVDPFRMTMGLFFDAWTDQSLPTAVPGLVEDECQNLALLAQAQRETNGRPPAIKFQLNDNNNIPKPNATWVIEDLTWGAAIRNRDTGLRERQQVTIQFLELIEDTTFNTLSPALTRRTAQIGNGSLAFPKTYTVAAGDTVGSIAARIYGKESKWHLIANANKIRDPSSIKVGQVLKIPDPTSAAAKTSTTKDSAVSTSLSPYVGL